MKLVNIDDVCAYLKLFGKDSIDINTLQSLPNLNNSVRHLMFEALRKHAWKYTPDQELIDEINSIFNIIGGENDVGKPE